MNKRVLLIGLPATGKTSFLAALHHYLGTHPKNSILQKVRLSPDEVYLNSIEERWLDCKSQNRTIQAEGEGLSVSMYLKDIRKDQEFILNVPDIKGEAFEEQLEHRQWTKEYQEQVEMAAGIFFFIHPAKLMQHNLMGDVPSDDEFFSPKEEDQEDINRTNLDLIDWNVSNVPTQVNVIEILQLHSEKISSANPLSIFFILSAWDEQLNKEHSISPKEWLHTNLPLLKQYLSANEERINYEVAGVSAQGGDYEKEEDLQELQSKDNQEERIKIVMDDINKIGNNISIPFQWIMDQWN